jgi:hypothetical protein
MSGLAYGKLELKGAKVYINTKDKKILLKNPQVYIHVKGYALARVTHLDVEQEILDKIILPKRGEFLSIHGIENGIEIVLGDLKEIDFEGKKLKVGKIEILHPFLTEVLGKNEKTRTWVGGKFGGIYIGFKKEQIEKLEKIAEEKFNFEL